MEERWYKIEKLPDLTLNKYSMSDSSGVDGVLEKHIAFLRQLNRQGILFGLSYHLFYLYAEPEGSGQRLQIFFMIRGNADSMANVAALIDASPLTKELFKFQFINVESDKSLKKLKSDSYKFNSCCFLTKSETLLSSALGDDDEYYIIREWEMNEDARLYNMCKMMEALKKTTLYRIDLYPVEKSAALREALRRPMNILRKRRDSQLETNRRDYNGKDVLDNYEKLIEKFDSSPHFISNIMVFADESGDAASILDAAGSESLVKGKFNVAAFTSEFGEAFNSLSFINGKIDEMRYFHERQNCESMTIRRGKPGLVICKDETAGLNLNYLPTMFSLEEITPFFRLPALYDGETIQIPKETAPPAVSRDNALFLGNDSNKYDVYFPLKLLPKHAFVSGVPGSGKTNTMLHITSSLWKDHRIPFLVLEPAKQEYRALINDPGMKGLYLFSPNADMSFPLHINPFEMPEGILVAEHIRMLCSVFEGAFSLFPPLPFLLDTAIESVYRELGWYPEDTYTKAAVKKRGLPTMSMLYKRLEEEIKATRYGEENRGNIESALQVRIGSLLRREMGDVFDAPESTFPPEKWLQVPAIIELESMGTDPANFLTLMLCSLIRETLKVDPDRNSDIIRTKETDSHLSKLVYTYGDKDCRCAVFEFPSEQLRNELFANREAVIHSTDSEAALTFSGNHKYKFDSCGNDVHDTGEYTFERDSITLIKGSKDVRHVIFIEEAHNLIGPQVDENAGENTNSKIAATAFIVKMLAEVRALHESIVIADQLPTKMAQEVLKNTGLKIGLKITSADDRALLGSTMAASSLQIEQIATFIVGEALIFYEGLMRPFSMRIKEWCGELKDKDEKKKLTTSRRDDDLRKYLFQSNNAEYKNENFRSIKITLKKYHASFKALETSLTEAKFWSDKMVETVSKYNGVYKEYNQILNNQENNHAAVTEDEMQKWGEELNKVLKCAIDLAQPSSIEHECLVIEQVYDLIIALEKLKTGRWERAGIPEEMRVKADLLKSKYARQAIEIYKGLYDVFIRDAGNKPINCLDTDMVKAASKAIQSLKRDIDRLSELYNAAYKYAAVYEHKYGLDSVKK